MTDLISRADAICEVLVNDGIDNIVDRINDLPSANYITEKTNDAIKTSNDVINRADAIDAVMKYKMPFTIQQEVAREIDALPSADAVQGDECDHCVYKWGMKGGDDE